MAAISVKRSINYIDAYKRENVLIFYRILYLTTNFVQKCKRSVWGFFCMRILGVKVMIIQTQFALEEYFQLR